MVMLLCAASKAFDHVNLAVLFNKLIARGVPGYIIRILIYWYSHQTMCVRWGSTLSHSLSATNGVRQGGILSPLLFNVYIYMNDLSATLATKEIGCIIRCETINHLMYADDLVLLSSSARGLNRLIEHCAQYGLTHDTINTTVTKVP
jgi:hypothetical protein